MNLAIDGKELLAVLKGAAGGPRLQLTIPVGRPVQALMRPIATRRDALNPSDLRCLTEWRNQFLASFLTEFEATTERTARWLAEHVDPHPGKILFMVEDLTRQSFAYVGLDQIDWDSGFGEADAIVRGGPAPKGSMTLVLQTLLAWAHTALGLESLAVRVRSNNSAVQFYEKCGFVEARRVPLRRIEEPGMIRYVEDPAAREAHGFELVHLDYRGPRNL